MGTKQHHIRCTAEIDKEDVVDRDNEATSIEDNQVADKKHGSEGPNERHEETKERKKVVRSVRHFPHRDWNTHK